jgi:DNA-binding transcriptional LysR family regulator
MSPSSGRRSVRRSCAFHELFREPRQLVVAPRHRLADRSTVTVREILVSRSSSRVATTASGTTFWLNGNRGKGTPSIWAEVSSAQVALA